MDTREIKNRQQLATLCYVKNQGDTLMIYKNELKNHQHRGKFNGLGGKVEPHESIEKCLFREVYEESSLKILAPELVGIILFPNFTVGLDWLVFVYIAQSSNREFVESNEGELFWIPDEAILNLPLWEGDKKFLPLVFARQKFFGRFKYFEARLQDFKTTKV